MKFNRVALVFLLSLLSAVISAQSYQIRVTWPVRLRASYSLDSPIVEKALAGDVLQVVGRFNRWLKIDRNGETLWLADWVDHTRLDQAPAGQDIASEQVPSDIDNCCFVNRQCATDQEWVDGYWAYQRNECPAPAQPGTSSAPTGGHAIPIEASPLNVAFITEVLNRLRAGSQKWYDYVISGADLIREDPNNYVGAALLQFRTIEIAPYGRHINSLDMDVNLTRTMAMLIHEACHIHRYDAGFPYDGYTKVNEELYCIHMDNTAISQIAPQFPVWNVGTGLGISHCEWDLTNHPRCRFYRENCEWSADNNRIISCPAIGLTRPSN